MALCRYKTNGETFETNTFNVHSMDEILAPDDSIPMREAEVFILAVGRWMTFGEAFRDRWLIPDNYNTRFTEPTNEADKLRGYVD